jgi:4-amino-4-deoxy-L-arabinose transferase-like glycosyltransferase
MRSAILVFFTGLAVAVLWTFVVFPRFSAIDQWFDLNHIGEIGENLVQGKGFSLGHGPTIRRAPGYPLFVAAVLTVFGFDPAHRQASYVPVQAVQCLFAAVSCVAVYFTSRRLFGERAALFSGILCAFWPQCLRYVGAIDVECMMTMLITLMTLCFVRFYQEPTLRNGLWLGLAIGVSILTKPLPLLLPFVVIALLWVRARRAAQPMPWIPAGAMLATTVALCVPWVIRNHIVTNGAFHSISSNAPGEFIRGYINAKPEFVFLRTKFQGNWDWQANLHEDQLLRRGGFSMFEGGDQSKGYFAPTWQNELTRDRIEAKEAKRLLTQEPMGFVRKFIVQMGTFWYIVETPGKSMMVGAFSLAALLLAFKGWRAAKQAGIDVTPIIAMLLYFNILYAAMLALARYSMPMFPTLMVLTGFGAASFAAARNSPSKDPVTIVEETTGVFADGKGVS